ncbi:hypothetical protein D9615_009400 [Tricholomella constricta]|uniref:Uncharacterized protein n=1 Tax=Tricholomella constricta TaxID=117010 RepID=A0A8H5H360_9AGAR|nr:hypothetical protein D9615_009400 [Tricholomella constricta]
MLPALVVSEAVGYATTGDPRDIFDDLKDVGLWPAHPYIKKVTGISVWHGVSTAQRHRNHLPAFRHHPAQCTEFFVGIFGAIDSKSDEPPSQAHRVPHLQQGHWCTHPVARSPTPLLLPKTSSASLRLDWSSDSAAPPPPTASRSLLPRTTFPSRRSRFSAGSLDTVAVYKVQSGGATNIGVREA